MSKETELMLYAARDTTTGKLVSDITNPRRKYWDRRGNAVTAISNYNNRTSYPGRLGRHGRLELVTFKLVEVVPEGSANNET